MHGSLARRARWTFGAFALLVAGVLAVPHLASADPAPSSVAVHRAHDGSAHAAQMEAVAEAQGLVPADDEGICAGAYEFRTKRGLHCARAPMLESMFTPEQLAGVNADAAPDARSSASTPQGDTKVSCIGDGSDGKRFQLVYARRSNVAERYANTATKMRAWANEVDQTMQASAAKTGGNRRVRWVTDQGCLATVQNIVVGTSVTTFTQLIDALEAQRLTSSNRKYLVAWDDSDSTDSFCGLGQSIPDSKPGPTNSNETQPLGAMFTALQPVCWSGPVAAHEIMHTLGAVQADAPNATRYGHCTDESDSLCYVDGAGTVVKQVCPSSQALLYDCNGDDYFNTNPPTGNYLKTHWNTATSGWLDPNAPAPPEYRPFTTWTLLVAQQYLDVLGRYPTSAESSSWVSQLTDGFKTKGELVDTLRRSSENTTNVDPTARLYRAFLGRAPDASGLEFWIGRRRAGTWSLTRMADSFASSSEFKTKYGSLTNREFVTRIYTDVLGRAADTSGVNYWTGKLDRKEKTRGQVMVGFSESSEYLRKQAQNTDVSVAYIFLLDRVPTVDETSSWVTRQKAGESHSTLLQEILATRSYTVRIAG